MTRPGAFKPNRKQEFELQWQMCQGNLERLILQASSAIISKEQAPPYALATYTRCANKHMINSLEEDDGDKGDHPAESCSHSSLAARIAWLRYELLAIVPALSPLVEAQRTDP